MISVVFRLFTPHVQHKSFKLLCSMTELDAPQEGYAPEQKLTCINIKRVGSPTKDNAEPEENLLITFDREIIDEIAALNSFSNTKRDMEVDGNSTFGSTEDAASPINENYPTAIECPALSSM